MWNSRKDTLNRHVKVHDSSQHPCTKCYKFFPSVVALTEHQQQSYQKEILCSFCGKGFERTSHLKEHIVALHGDRKFSCPVAGCSKTFAKDERYQDHLNSHSDLRPHTCCGCEKRFYNRYERKRHQSVCIGQKHVECDKCKQEFKSADALAKHTDAQHKKLVYPCTSCGKQYKYQNSLLRHRESKY
ncbi:hypothetical protein DPMN_190473 [Dreissena polymorpha]|uniref:C2H2-type domain-containing protein n=1 Tax=Dreissena polymorpha TaxID=45954 RepID=A0A9D4DU86_DREPO|nr:hypothetical protein DPMN_190473 [Dreissena polymorpha]